MIPLFAQQPTLKRCVAVAVDRAIKEVCVLAPGLQILTLSFPLPEDYYACDGEVSNNCLNHYPRARSQGLCHGT